MSRNNTLGLIELVASGLEELTKEVVFVGGASVVFLVPEMAHDQIRMTDDVDVIVDIATTIEYHKFCEKLRAKGYQHVMEGPICRFRDPNNIIVDVMPLDESVLGFSNYWYKQAMENSELYRLPSQQEVRYCSIPYFLGTKFEAFKGRAGRDYYGRDFEDICFILEQGENIELIIYDLKDLELKEYLKNEFALLLNNPDLWNIFAGMLNNENELDAVKSKIKFIAQLKI